MKTNNIPFVVEKDSNGDRSYDIYSRLLEDRVIFIGEEIDDSLANSVVAQLILLDQRESDRDICIYVNSPGGSVTAGLAILDTMNYIKSDVKTVCIGLAASMGAVLLSAGTKGKRIALPNSRIMIHQPNQTFRQRTMTVTEQEIDLKLIKDMKLQLINILAKNTGKKVSQVAADCEFDNWMNTEQALKYGIIDEILVNKKDE